MSLINDVATLTTITVTTVEKIFDKAQLCILHKFFENEKNNEPLTYVDLKFGTLLINHDGDELKYKFVPSKSFEKSLQNVVQTGESPLIDTIENVITEKMANIYKDLF